MKGSLDVFAFVPSLRATKNSDKLATPPGLIATFIIFIVSCMLLSNKSSILTSHHGANYRAKWKLKIITRLMRNGLFTLELTMMKRYTIFCLHLEFIMLLTLSLHHKLKDLGNRWFICIKWAPMQMVASFRRELIWNYTYATWETSKFSTNLVRTKAKLAYFTASTVVN